MTEEIWIDVLGYEGFYKVSNTGKLKSLKRIIKRNDGKYNHIFEKIMTGGKTPRGYTFHCLKICNVKEQKYIHRLVAQAFIPNPLNLPQVNHIDGNKSNNDVSNLEWCTSKENMMHAYNNGLSKKGEETRSSKLTEKQVLEIRENKHKIGQEYLGLIYGVTKSCISGIQRRIKWKHI